MNIIVGKGELGLNETAPILDISKAVITQNAKNIEDTIKDVNGNNKILE